MHNVYARQPWPEIRVHSLDMHNYNVMRGLSISSRSSSLLLYGESSLLDRDTSAHKEYFINGLYSSTYVDVINLVMIF